MKTISLFANCNPLSKNCFICVERSSNYGCSVNFYRDKIMPKSIAILKELGYQCYSVTQETELSDKY